jgi:ADP-ribosylglycohydrolase
MIGAIAGDIIGSVYEWERIKTKQFDRSICSVRIVSSPMIQSLPSH